MYFKFKLSSMVIIFSVITKFCLTSSAHATPVFIPDDVLFMIMSFQHPAQMTKLKRLSKRTLKLANHSYLRKTSPYGVILKDRSVLFYQEAAQKGLIADIVSFNDLKRSIVSIKPDQFPSIWHNASLKASASHSEPEYIEEFLRIYSKIPRRIFQRFGTQLKTDEDVILHTNATLLTMKFYISIIRNIAWDSAWFSFWKMSDRQVHYRKTFYLNQAHQAANGSLLNKIYQELSTIVANYHNQDATKYVSKSFRTSRTETISKLSLPTLIKVLKSKHRNSGTMSYRLSEKITFLYFLQLALTSDEFLKSIYQISFKSLQNDYKNRDFQPETEWKKLRRAIHFKSTESEKSLIAPWFDFLDQSFKNLSKNS